MGKEEIEMKRTKKIVKKTQSKGRYCVINSTAAALHGGPTINRTVVDNENAAVQYAKGLMTENFRRGKTDTVMYVVKIVKVVRSSTPPISVTSPDDVELHER